MYRHFSDAFSDELWTKNVWKTGILIAGGFQALGILQLHNNGVCKDANRWWGLPFRVFQTQFLCLVNYSTGLKTRGYSPLRASRLPDAFEPLSNERWVVSFMTKILNWLPQNGCRNNKNLPKSSWTCFRISLRANINTSPRTDPETSSGWPPTEETQSSLLTSHYSNAVCKDGERQPSSSKIIGQELYCPLLIPTIPHRKLNDINLNGF